MKKYLNLNLLVSLGLIVFGAAWLKLTMGMKSAGVGDSSIWGTGATIPRFLLIVFLILNAWVLVSEAFAVRTASDGGEFAPGKGALRVVALIALLFLYILVLETVGYLLSTIVMMFGALFLFGERNKIILGAVPIGFSLFLYLVFKYALVINLP